MAWLFDTNVVSEIWKPKPNRSVAAFFESLPRDQMFLSTVSIVEFRHGANTVADLSRRKQLNDWLSFEIRPLFQNRVLDISESILLHWLVLVDQGRRANRTYSQPDLFLAATALEHNLTLVTRNTKDFTTIPELKLFNPWEPTS